MQSRRRLRRGPAGQRRQRSCPQAMHRVVHCLWTTSPRRLRRRPRRCPIAMHGRPGWASVVPKRHARRAVTRSLLKRQVRAAVDRVAGLPQEAAASALPKSPGEPRRPAGAGLYGGLWIVRLRAPFDRLAFPSAASQALRGVVRAELDGLLAAALLRCAGGGGGAARPASRRGGRAARVFNAHRPEREPSAARPADVLVHARLAATRPDRPRPRLPAAAQPVAGHAMPVRADLLALCARPRSRRTARRPAATWRRAGCCAAIRGATAASTRCRRSRRRRSRRAAPAAADGAHGGTVALPPLMILPTLRNPS